MGKNTVLVIPAFEFVNEELLEIDGYPKTKEEVLKNFEKKTVDFVRILLFFHKQFFL